MIRDANVDLGVYLDMLPDCCTQSQHTEGSSQPKPSCCVSITAEDGATGELAAKKTRSCCAPDVDESGCCGSSKQTSGDSDLAKMAAELGDIDLNEWVGKYLRCHEVPM